MLVMESSRIDAEVTLMVDGSSRTLTVDTRTTLLDALRDRLGVTSPKKGCDHGQCDRARSSSTGGAPLRV